ncbi:MAG: hypothetical protein U0838_14870 [Chloroflexota bacterium]
MEVGRRRLDLAFLGREGHTDNDIIVATEDAARSRGRPARRNRLPVLRRRLSDGVAGDDEAILAMAGDGTIIVPGRDPPGALGAPGGADRGERGGARRIHAR